MTEREKSKIPAGMADDVGIGLLALKFPVIAVGKALLDAFNGYQQKRAIEAIEEFQRYLADIIGDVQQYFSDPWLESETGRQFWEKVFNAAIGAQAAGKRKQFAYALVNGIKDTGLDELDKLRFVDILRQMSLPAILVLSEMHLKFGTQTRPSSPDAIVKELNLTIDPYTVESAVVEMQGLGLFTPHTEWRKTPAGVLGSSYNTGTAYNDYTRRFITFISKAPNGAKPE